MNSIRYLPSLVLLIAAVYFGLVDEPSRLGSIRPPAPPKEPENTEIFIKQLSVKSFEDAIASPKDAFVMFYAPWCGHCRSFGPVFEKVGKTFSGDSDSLVLGKIDLEAEEAGQELAQRYNIRGYPTLMWFPRDNKNGVPYEGSRDPKAVVDFINTNGGYHRLMGGDLDQTEGTHETLNGIAKKFMQAQSDDERQQFIDGVKSSDAPEKIQGIYEKIMRKVMEKGTIYVSSEKSRLDSVLAEKGSLSPAKQDEFHRKRNVLAVFA